MFFKKMQIEINMDELAILRDRMLRMCKSCLCVKPPRVHHCRQCNRCVVRMDHHCPWIGNCVGIYNQKKFLLFNSYVLYLCIFTIIDSVIVGVGDLMKSTCNTDNFLCNEKWKQWLVIIAFGMAIVFALFTASMIYQQVNFIREQTSTIDKKQMSSNAHKSLKSKIPPPKPLRSANSDRYEEVMGSGGCLNLWWLLPVNRQNTFAVENELNQNYI